MPLPRGAHSATRVTRDSIVIFGGGLQFWDTQDDFWNEQDFNDMWCLRRCHSTSDLESDSWCFNRLPMSMPAAVGGSGDDRTEAGVGGNNLRVAPRGSHSATLLCMGDACSEAGILVLGGRDVRLNLSTHERIHLARSDAHMLLFHELMPGQDQEV